MLHFFRLTRPFNLAIIAATMYGTGWYLEDLFSNGSQYGIQTFPFFLLVFSTVLIAAAGNIINDYFDVRADRINKPEKMIVGVHIKRRWVIIWHWMLNLTAFGIAVYLSWIFDTFWYLFIHLLSINLLWGYSSYFKRKFLIGNTIIAGLTATVPLLVGFYFYHHPLLVEITEGSGVKPFADANGRNYIVFIVTAIAFFAFILNLAREIVKDIQDVEGDKVLRAKTLPIALGTSNTKIVTHVVLLGGLTGIILLITLFSVTDFKSLHPIILAALLNLLSMVFLIRAEGKKALQRVNNSIKLAMVIGMLSPVYWKILLQYVD